MALCNKCGQVIKNIITIQGKSYGTTCAQHVLGTELPFGFSGDYDVYTNKLAEIKAKRDLEATNRKNIEEEYWLKMTPIFNRVMFVLSRSYDLTEFELNFCRSLKYRIEDMMISELSEKQLALFEKIEDPIVERRDVALRAERDKLVSAKFTELAPMAKEKGWTVAKLREYINTII